MKSFKATRDDNVEFIFNCCQYSDLVFGTYSASSFPVSETPIAIPNNLKLIPSRDNASQNFINGVELYGDILDKNDLINHTFTLDDNHEFSFGSTLGSVTFTYNGVNISVFLGGYQTLPYCDEYPIQLQPSLTNPVFSYQFNWFGATPDVVRIYGSATCYPSLENVSYPSLLFDFWDGVAPTSEDTDPYSQGGNSSGGGGTGDFDNTSDTIDIPSLPSISGLNTGFFTAFVCTQSQLQSVSAYLWNNVIDDILDVNTGFGEKIDALKKVVANPYDAIMGCSLVPVSPPTGGSKEMKMYGIVQTGISLPYASSRWVAVDCGTLNIHEFWGSYLDYSPYTKTTSLYLPYIGVVSVDIDLIMAKALQVVYHVDILSGICIAYIVVDGSVKFQYQGHCSTTIPITSADYSGSIQAGLGLVGNVSNIVAGGMLGASGGAGGALMGAVGSAVSQAPSIASNVMGMKPDIKSGGGVGSSGGILGVQRPYLIIERPRQSVPERQNHFTGYPSNMYATIGSLSGYTEFERVNIDGITLTDEEKTELENILKGGVYL